MRGWKLDRPPRSGLLILILLVVANVVIFGVLGTRPAPADSYVSAPAPEPAGSSPATPVTAGSAVPSSEEAAETPVLVVYGDGYAAGNELGGLGAAGWPALVAQRTGMTLQLHAVSQAGYASIGTTGESYPALVDATPPTAADVTILFGSRNDADESLATVETNAARTMSLARQAAPDAVLVVVGPAWDDADVPAEALAVRDVVRAAADAVGAVFVDPLSDGWFYAMQGGIAVDGISPTDAGHVYMADLLVPVVTEALAAQ